MASTLSEREITLKPSQDTSLSARLNVPDLEGGIRIDIQEASVQFGELTVLKQMNLTIPSGQFLGVVGRSGCGKSTLLRLIAGLEAASQGSVRFDGELTSGLRPDVRVMFQDARLLPWKSVLDNVRIGVPGGNRDKALEALELVGLADRAKDWPSVLSGGQKQRVSLARALAGDPDLLLFDEPLGALDALTRIEMQQLLERIWLKRRFTAVLVTHDVSEAVALTDRVVLVEHGMIAHDLPIALARPREKDSGFAHYESSLLNRVLEKRPAPGAADGFSI